MSSSDEAGVPQETMHLDLLTGPPLEPFGLEPGADVILGRSTKCDIQLVDPDKTVSREHIRLWRPAGQCMIEDLDSKHGTFLNGHRLPAHRPTYLSQGDLLVIGPWQLRVRIGEDFGSIATTTDEGADRAAGSRVERIHASELDDIATHRLRLLMECASSIHSATDERELARSALSAVTRGAGFSRAALVRPLGSLEQVEVLAAEPPVRDNKSFIFSRTLLRAASGGEMVRLTDSPELQVAQSVISLGISSALCVPVRVGRDLYAYLYLDSDRDASRVHSDAAAFCHAVGQMCGMALANIHRRRLEERQQRLDADLRAARAAQIRMMPPERGLVGAVRYAMRSVPGRGVAGDLVDVIEVSDHETAVMLGDVSGKGMGAAIVMAMTQSALALGLRTHGDLHRAVKDADRYVAMHSSSGEFVSLWVGVIDRASRTFRYINAGHGYGFHRRAEGAIDPVDARGGLLLGVAPERDHRIDERHYDVGDRLVLFSDGLVEQSAEDASDRFGVSRAEAVVASAGNVEEDVDVSLDAVRSFAGSETLSDDVTIISLELPE